MAKKIKKTKKFFFVLGSFCVGCIITLYNAFPGILERYFQKKTYRKVGLEIKAMAVGKDIIEYVEGGKGQTILFIHGFQGDKNSWMPYTKRLSSYHKVVAIDLPGHGGSSFPSNQNYDIQSLAEAVNRFVEEKKIGPFHLVGTSMGGGISTVYASKYPQKLLSLTLINPLGVNMTEKSDLLKKMEEGKNLLFPENLSDFDEFSTFLTGHPLPINQYFKRYALKKMLKKRPFYQKVFSELIKSKTVETLLPQISTRTLLLMGGRDRVLHPSSYKIYEEKLPNALSKRIKEGSHVFCGPYFEEALNTMICFFSEPVVAREE